MMHIMKDKPFDHGLIEENKNEKRKEFFFPSDLTFFPALAEHTVLVQRDWLSWSVFHWPHPEDSVCWAYAYTCTV
jgi:hypothetical protein